MGVRTVSDRDGSSRDLTGTDRSRERGLEATVGPVLGGEEEDVCGWIQERWKGKRGLSSGQAQRHEVEAPNYGCDRGRLNPMNGTRGATEGQEARKEGQHLAHPTSCLEG